MKKIVKYVLDKRGKGTHCLVLEAGVLSPGTLRTACGFMVAAPMGRDAAPEGSRPCSKCAEIAGVGA